MFQKEKAEFALLRHFGKGMSAENIFDVNPPETLFHYTSANGIRMIIENAGMFASPIFSMNDPSELIFGWEIVEEVCEELATKDENKDIANALLNSPFLKRKEFSEEFPVMNLICFSASSDNLSQWRAYGENGSGFALELNTKMLMKKPDDWKFFKCIYDRSVQKRKILDLINICERAHPSIKKNLDLDSIVKMSIGIIWQVISVFKHPAYKDEEEWRMRIVLQDLRQFSGFVTGPNLKVSALILLKGHSVIKNILIGPKNDFKTTSFALKTLLHKSRLALHEKINVEKSKAPYR